MSAGDDHILSSIQVIVMIMGVMCFDDGEREHQ